VTREDAIAAAHAEAERTGKAQAVYRFPAWRKDVYGVRAVDALPTEALRYETVKPGQAPVVETALPIEQASLFD
jgi:adenylosuccinate synthase